MAIAEHVEHDLGKQVADLLPELIDVVASHLGAGHFPSDASTLTSPAAIIDDIPDVIRANDLDGSVPSAGRAAVTTAIDAGHGSAGFAFLAARKIGRSLIRHAAFTLGVQR